jgi:hypothetical protein
MHSVWDWDKVRYDYYRSDRPASIGGWNPLTGLGIPPKVNTTGSPIGIDIEDALPELPSGAVHTGTGAQAVGQVCRRPGSSLGAVDAGSSRHFTRNEISAYLAGFALGGFVWEQKAVATLALALAALVVGASAGQHRDDG